MAVIYEIGVVVSPDPEPFAVIAHHTDRIGPDGDYHCELKSLHMTRQEAEAVISLLRFGPN